MSSNFSKKLKAKKTSDTDVKNIREELKNVPDNGILEDIKAPYETADKKEEDTSDIVKDKPVDVAEKEKQSEIIKNDTIEAVDISATTENSPKSTSSPVISEESYTEELESNKTVS